MKVHHVSCGTMCPVGFELLDVHPKPHAMICHVLVVETNDGLVLVDTGFGTHDVANRSQLGGPFNLFVRPTLDPRETALARLESLGFHARDVRHIVPTHLDLDHAGGLPDFPDAKVHVYSKELDAATRRATFHERMRYRPAHFAHEPKFASYEVEGERWNGFECVRQLEGLPPEILLVPTVGHTRGHVAVVVESEGGALCHAGDAYFHRDEMRPTEPRCPLPLRLFQSSVAIDDLARVRNRERLRLLARDHAEVRIFCAHDPVEAEALGVVR
ncbi:MAG: MBL fold metallo-hydrolase [Polyangiaceae bacterium]|nr:MBL fold metallo-hydrolase [Polyangiaceae bacterium]